MVFRNFEKHKSKLYVIAYRSVILQELAISIEDHIRSVLKHIEDESNRHGLGMALDLVNYLKDVIDSVRSEISGLEVPRKCIVRDGENGYNVIWEDLGTA